MPERYVFLDFDNTLSDQYQQNLQYVRAVGDLLAPQFGGNVETWAKATADMMEAIEQDYLARFLNNPLNGYCAWLDGMQEKAMTLLFMNRGLPVPPNAKAFAIETQFRALASTDSTFPGTYAALQTLFEDGYRVQIASGQESEWLRASLMGAGVESFTEKKYGPDLVDCAKEGPEFYERMFAQIGIAPAETLIVDNDPNALGWAMQVGAKTIQARLSPEEHPDDAPGVLAVLTDLHDLPALIKKAFSIHR